MKHLICVFFATLILFAGLRASAQTTQPASWTPDMQVVMYTVSGQMPYTDTLYIGLKSYRASARSGKLIKTRLNILPKDLDNLLAVFNKYHLTAIQPSFSVNVVDDGWTNVLTYKKGGEVFSLETGPGHEVTDPIQKKNLDAIYQYLHLLTDKTE